MLRFAGTVWRMMPLGAYALAPASAPEGRFHHSGQFAIYTSLTPEGTEVAIRRYMRPDNPPRVVVPLKVQSERIADLRGQPEVSVVWQDIRATGAPSPTWRHSDKARGRGAQGMLYSSRSRPELTHLVIFDPATVAPAGMAQPWPPGADTL